MKRKNAWEKYDDKGKADVFEFCEGYRKFISSCKTERECIEEFSAKAENHGYRRLDEVISEDKKLKPGDKVYAVNMNKMMAIFHIGEDLFDGGMNILGAHIDSPRLDLKQNPLYEDENMALMETHYYGGVKKYQWVAMPMALHGVVVKKDGSSVKVSMGESFDEPVTGVSDLLIHLASAQLQKRGDKVVEGEDLNLLVGSMPLKGEESEPVKANILSILKEKYGMEESDFHSAEFEAVPAGPARDYGFDSSMIIGYGQDDRVCAYPSAEAIFALDNTKKTCVCLLVDKEEIGSVGATGMHSRFFENTVAEVMNCAGCYSELALRRTMSRSRVLSSDVSAAFDSNYPSVMEKNNCAYFGGGLTFNKYTGSRGKSGSNDANPEYIAKLRKILDDKEIRYQTSELGKVDRSGGGTIAYILANYGMEVIDSGIAVQNMHAPYEVSSKVDIYEARLAYETFLRNME